MKRIPLLFATLFSINVTCLFAQKYSSIDSVPRAPVFSFTQDSVIDLVKDKQFIKENAKIYVDFLSKTLSQHLLTGSADTLYLIQNREHSNIILGNYSAAERDLDTYIARYPENLFFFLPDKVFLDVKTGRENSYSTAISNELKHCDRYRIESYGSCYGQDMLHKNPNFISQTSFGFLSGDMINFRKNFDAIKSLHTKLKKLSMNEMGDLLWVCGSNIIADSVVNDFINTDPLHVEKWAKVWNSMLYHFTKKDSLHDVLACNYSVFYRDLFDPKILWNNPGEIPFNHIDDDQNGIVDDVHGYEYKIGNLKIKEPLALSWEETDSITVLKEPFDSSGYKSPIQFYKHNLEHGSMTVELMLKGNPRVHFMALEQHWNDFGRCFPSMFTTDITLNQHLVDSCVDLLINSFGEEATYCNRYKVRVVVINGMLREENLYFKECGHDSSEAKAFEKKMDNKFKNGYAIAYGKAPNTLYINSAGNLNINIDIDSTREMISFLHLPNIIVAGALYKDLHKASYSNYGSRVDVFAPAHFPLLHVKLNYRSGQYIESGGTSAAAPVIANLAIQILELNPNLTAAQVKQLIIEGADKEPYEKGINIIDPKKTIALLKNEF